MLSEKCSFLGIDDARGQIAYFRATEMEAIIYIYSHVERVD